MRLGFVSYTTWNARRRLRRGFGIGLSSSAVWSYVLELVECLPTRSFDLGWIFVVSRSWSSGVYSAFDCYTSFGCGRRLFLRTTICHGSLWFSAVSLWTSSLPVFGHRPGKDRNKGCRGQVWHDDLCTCMRRKMQHMIVHNRSGLSVLNLLL
jgi:hypothetical protein